MEELKRISQAEADSVKFTKISERFFELTHILITQCKEDLENLEQVCALTASRYIAIRIILAQNLGQRYMGCTIS